MRREIGKNAAGPLAAMAMAMAMAMMMMAMAMAVALALVLTGGLHAAEQPIAPAPVIDNGRVLVWRLQLSKGETGPSTPKDLDTVVMFLEGGRIRSEAPDGHSRLETRHSGDAIWVPRGSAVKDTAVSGPVEEVVIGLKDAPVEPLVNSSGLPSAFPRPGSRKILENSRVIVWQYSWVPGRPSPMHFHDKDVVVAYREEGSLQSVSPTGERTVNAHHPGEIRFNTRNRSHSEQLLSGRQSAVMVELK
jgi:hypothetical protein